MAGFVLNHATPDEILALVKERPNDPKLYWDLGGAYLHKRQLLEAIDACEQALNLAPDNAFSFLFLGCLLEAVDAPRARMCYERAAELLPQASIVHWADGDLSRQGGHFARAEEAYNKAVEVNPSDEQARLKLAEWNEFIGGLRGRTGLTYYLVVRTQPGQLVSYETARSLLCEAQARLHIETLYTDLDPDEADEDADTEADVLRDELANGEVTLGAFREFCQSAEMPPLDDAGQVMPNSAQQFRWSRSGQNIFHVVLPATETAASESFNALADFARDHDLDLWVPWPVGAGEIDLKNPGQLPPSWREFML
jgi:tetratricopeptide (TPR) repeat protein